MAQINAKQVQELRAETGLAMMDCKKALVEAEGDNAKAKEVLRKKFADKMTDRASKETANGRIGVYAGPEAAALVELRCETDFVATNDVFKAMADRLAEHCAKTGITEVDGFKNSEMDGGQTVTEFMVDGFGKMKENMEIRRLRKIEGSGACYVHHNGQVAAAIVCDKAPEEAGRQVCMHIASTQMITSLTREDTDPKAVAEAREKATAEAQGKPEQIIVKIVDGKMNKWYAERVLLEQPFVMDDKKSVCDFAKENGFSIKAFAKFEVGGA